LHQKQKKKIRYSEEICVPPVIQGDPHSWLMSRGPTRGTLLLAPTQPQQQMAIEEVANGVANLLVKENSNSSMLTASKMQLNSSSLNVNLEEQLVTNPLASVDQEGLVKQPSKDRLLLEACSSALYTPENVTDEGKKDNRQIGNKSAPTSTTLQDAGMAEVNQIATMTQMKGSDTSAPIPADDTTPTQNQPDLKNPGKWVRFGNREELETQSKIMQPAEYEQTKMHNQNSKRFRPPTLSECLGEE
jgi:hypothetical protein